ncbi:anthranilate synthase component I family protein [Curtobacterium sp. Leaf261]|uniref:anthranilate synthase component I family protein n=1 Tax=Curtobacterium sp. Leaf261 TaxID=1736311 RepID=UPI0006F68DBF|nr:anthranilate synthase component I family protein [Curtobacterium sp. Leaf261]KQO63037.1 hypothetical protein ASF23_09185 [Curtobacterium sp. Leaf261]
MRIEVRRIDGVVDPAAVAVTLDTGTGDVIWLDSARAGSNGLSHTGGRRGQGQGDGQASDQAGDQADRARWSIVAAVDGPFGATFVHDRGLPEVAAQPAAEPWFRQVIDAISGRRAADGGVGRDGGLGRDGSGGVPDEQDEFFAVLEQVLDATPAVAGAPVPGCGFALGWIGYIGYELGREPRGPMRFADGHPDGALRFVDRAVLLDARDGVCWVLALVDDTGSTSASSQGASATNRTWLAATAVAVGDLAAETRPTALSGDATNPDLPTTGLPAAGRVSRARYERDVDACRAEIRDGNAFQVCLTTSFSVAAPRAVAGTPRSGVSDARLSGTEASETGVPGPLARDPEFAEYLRLRTADPVPFGSFVRLGRVTIASRSPERFVAVSAAGRVVAEPIKGTRPRGRTPGEDDGLLQELTTSAKDRAENVMIVDLLRNDLLRTAIPGSVRVERLCAIESYATVHQMVSTVVGTVRPGVSPAAVVRAAFPPGSMTGAPKISAMAIADRLEGAPRGVYSGAIGYFSTDGAVDLAVAIRTLVSVRHADAGVVRSLGAGGAVTWSSSAHDEADEVETKTRSVLGTLGSAAVW